MARLPITGQDDNIWGDTLNGYLGVEHNPDGTHKNSGSLPFHTAKEYGAIGDGTLHPLSERFTTLAAAQAVYPFATALTQSIDAAAIRQMLEVTCTNIAHLTYTPPGWEGKGGICFVEPGQYLIDIPLYVQIRQRLLGSGGGDQYGGSMLKRADGANCDIVVCGTNSDWHYGEVGYLAINGNRRLAGATSGGNTAGRGMVVNNIMETTSVHNIFSYANPDDGFMLKGAVPGKVRECSSFHNGGWGFNLAGTGNSLMLDTPSGDMNDAGFMRIRGNGVDGTSQLGSVNACTIINPKYERGNVIVNKYSTQATHDPAIVIDQYGGPVTIIGGSGTGFGEGTTAPATGLVGIQRNANSQHATVRIINHVIGAYVTPYKDLVNNNYSVASDSTGGTRTLNVDTNAPANVVPLSSSATWTNSTIAAGASLNQYVYCAGAALGDFAQVTYASIEGDNWIISCRAVTDYVVVRATNQNTYAAPANLGTVYVRATKR